MPKWILCRFCHRKKHTSTGQEHYSRIIKVPQNQNMWVIPNTLPAFPLNISGSLPEESEAARHDALQMLGNTQMLKFGLNSSWPLLRWAWIRAKVQLLPSHGCLTSFHSQSKFKHLIQGHKQKCRLVLEESVSQPVAKSRERRFDLSSFRCFMLNCIRLCSLPSGHLKYIFCFLQGVLHYSYYSCSIFSYCLL